MSRLPPSPAGGAHKQGTATPSPSQASPIVPSPLEGCDGCDYESACGYRSQALGEGDGCRGGKPAHHGRRGCRRHSPSPGQHAHMLELDDDALYDDDAGTPQPPRKCLRVRSSVRRVVETEPDEATQMPAPALGQCGDCKGANKPGDLCEAGLCRGCCDGASCWPGNTQGIAAAEAATPATEAAPDAPARATEVVPVVCTAEVEARF